MDMNASMPNEQARSSFLSASRAEMYDALRLFHEHVKHALSLMFTVLTAVFAILGFMLKEPDFQQVNLPVIRMVGGSILVLLFPLGIVLSRITARYYELYVAALVYAAELHESVGLASHAWFRQIGDYRAKLGPDKPIDRLLKRRTYGWPHSWFLYSILLWAIGVVALVAGVAVLLAL